MRIGIPVWNGRVSPVLDTAERLIVVDTAAPEGQVREEVALQAARLPTRAARLASLGLDVLVCGAISRPLSELLETAGVPMQPWMAGEVEEILQALAAGSLDRTRYGMPGCRGGRGRCGHGRNCRGRGRARRRKR